MGRTAVRTAIQSYLAGAGVQFLTKVYAHPPKFTDGGQFYRGEAPGIASGGIIYIHLARQSENRIALGGPSSGQKKRVYSCGLVCVFRSKKVDTQAVGADNDTFLDSLVDTIEASRTAGSPSTIFQWGEGDGLYGNDIRVQAEMPRPINQQSSQVFSIVEVTVVEMLST